MARPLIRSNAKQTVQTQSVKPSDFIRQGFADTDIVRRAANDNTPQGNNQAAQGQKDSKTQVKQGIVGLTTSKTPEELQNDNQARRASLSGQRSPEQQKLFENGAELGLGKKIQEGLDFTKIKNKPGDNDERYEGQANEIIPGNEEGQNSSNELGNGNTSVQFSPNEDPEGDFIKRIQSKLKLKGIDLNYNDTLLLVNSNFKVRFPIELMIGHFSKGIVEITGLLMGIFIAIVGFASSSAASFILPVFGTLAGFTISAIGLGISIATFLVGIILTIFMIWLRMRYLQNASGVMVKVSFIRRRAYIWGLRRIWYQFFGRIIPLVGIFIGVSADILAWRYVVKEIREIKNIVDSEKLTK